MTECKEKQSSKRKERTMHASNYKGKPQKHRRWTLGRERDGEGQELGERFQPRNLEVLGIISGLGMTITIRMVQYSVKERITLIYIQTPSRRVILLRRLRIEVSLFSVRKKCNSVFITEELLMTRKQKRKVMKIALRSPLTLVCQTPYSFAQKEASVDLFLLECFTTM